MHVLHMQTWVQNPHTYKINKSQQANEQKGNGRYLIVHYRRCTILKTLRNLKIVALDLCFVLLILIIVYMCVLAGASWGVHMPLHM